MSASLSKQHPLQELGLPKSFFAKTSPRNGVTAALNADAHEEDVPCPSQAAIGGMTPAMTTATT